MQSEVERTGSLGLIEMVGAEHLSQPQLAGGPINIEQGSLAWMPTRARQVIYMSKADQVGEAVGICLGCGDQIASAPGGGEDFSALVHCYHAEMQARF